MKYRCKVIGHELKETKTGNLLIVKLKGYDRGAEIKAQLLVEEDERVKYPFGCGCVMNFDVQQDLTLEK